MKTKIQVEYFHFHSYDFATTNQIVFNTHNSTFYIQHPNRSNVIGCPLWNILKRVSFFILTYVLWAIGFPYCWNIMDTPYGPRAIGCIHIWHSMLFMRSPTWSIGCWNHKLKIPQDHWETFRLMIIIGVLSYLNELNLKRQKA